MIQFDDFQKMDIRVSTILEVEKVAKPKIAEIDGRYGYL